ncbi:MAG TPA: hypothetical protein PKH54_01035 [Myxococcota bacterium]|nr:hypothetical protein [Myxococcota bacterium]HOC98497.1 hypothetical protein [Myxococcota bacterium]HOH76948.1 hypothetical protein [Myxococcota bacterium]HPV03066.1 hypothetical protein [Myxococcota bacterium]
MRAGSAHDRKTIIPVAAACLAAMMAAGCGADDKGQADFLEYELWPSTHIFDNDTAGQIISIDEDWTFLFRSDSEIAARLAPKHVLMAGETPLTPRGTMRRVTEITPLADGIEVRTERALLQHAFKSFHTKFTREVAMEQGSLLWDTEPGAKLLDSTEHVTNTTRKSGGDSVGPVSIDYYPFNGDNDISTDEDQIHVTATFSGSVYYNFGIDFDWPDVSSVIGGDPLPEITVGYSVDARAESSITADGVAMYSYDRRDTLAHAPVTGFWIWILYFTVSIDLMADIEGGASSLFHLETGAGASFVAAAEYSTDDGGRLIPPTADFWTLPSNVSSTESAYLKVSVGPRLRLALYDFFGPHLTVWGFGELSADMDRDPCWDLRAGVYGDIGIGVALWGETLAEWSKEFDIADTSIMSGECIPDPNAPEVPDIIDPLFDPWSKILVDTAGGVDLDRDFMALQHTIDGHWLVAGSGMKTLSKVTNDGAVLWSRRYLRPDATLPIPLNMNRAINTRDLGIFATAYSPVMLMKLDADGGVVRAWRPDIEFQPVVGLQVLQEDSAGNVFVGGPFVKEDMGSSDAWIFKLAPDGTVLWSKIWGDPAISEWVTGFVRLDQDLVVVGESFGLAQDPAHQSWAMRIGPDGQARWIKRIGGALGTESLALKKAMISSNGDIIAGGSYGLGGPDQVLMKIKPDDGTLGWVNGNKAGDTSGALGIDLTDVFQLSDKGYLMTGLWWTGGTDHLWVARADSVGRMTWLKKLETGIEAGAPGIVMTGDGGALVAAYTEIGDQDHSVWLTRLPIKTGAIDLDPALASISDETFKHDQNPDLVFTTAATGLIDLPLTLLPDLVRSTRISPVETVMTK